MLLTIDAGNTRVKWGLFNPDGALLTHGACMHTELINIEFPQASRVIVSNVAGKKIKKLITQKLSADLPVNWMQTQPHAYGITNCYQPPETLGTDRWAALIGAWHRYHGSCVVVNAGTAVTIDALLYNSDHHAEFLGGLIIPGLNLMQQSLGKNTAQLPMPNGTTKDASKHIFAKNTGDAIRLGILYAVSGTIMQMTQHLQTQCHSSPIVVLSGGDANTLHCLLKECMTNEVCIVDNLVLHGLYLLDVLAPACA